ncbi:hypothetical protein CDIK_0286 [Cucumispora dikerogammari]|nr:hypothetical protein CDIK_0286 [Cucumispora dikerogammari]
MFLLPFSLLTTTFFLPSNQLILLSDKKQHDFVEDIHDGNSFSIRVKLVFGPDAYCTVDRFDQHSQRKRLITQKLEFDKEFTIEYREPGVYKIGLFRYSRSPVLVEISVTSNIVEDLNKQNRELKQGIGKVFNELNVLYWAGVNTLRLKSQIQQVVELWKFRGKFLCLLAPLYLAIAYCRHLYLKSFFVVKSQYI